jgi:hypothetical protein
MIPKHSTASSTICTEALHSQTRTAIEGQNDIERLRAYSSSITKWYYFAEKLCMGEFMDKIMDEIRAHQQRCDIIFSIDTTRQIYENTHRTSKLRYYAAVGLAWILVYRNVPSEILNQITSVCLTVPDLLGDVFRAQNTYGCESYVCEADYRGNQVIGFSPCEFHVHSAEQPCHQKKLA